MIKKGFLLIGLLGLGASSCIDHEVIPAPEPMVELICSFEGTVGGSNIEYTENVNEYACTPSIAKQTLSGLTDAQYLFAMQSTSQVPSIQIALGSLSWYDPTGTDTPSLTMFNAFFTTNDTPEYSNAALDGFEVSFRDEFGDVWRSYFDSIPQDMAFVPGSIVQESDSKGDYSKFTCTFNCPLYHVYNVIDISVNPQTNPPTMRDSVAMITVEDGLLRGYFKR